MNFVRAFRQLLAAYRGEGEFFKREISGYRAKT